MASVYDKLEINLNLLLVKNDPIMQKNGISVFVLIIELSLIEWDAVIWFRQKNPPWMCVMSVTLLSLGIFNS